MRISTVEAEVPVAEDVTVTEDTLSVDLGDGRRYPCRWRGSPGLRFALPGAQRRPTALKGREVGDAAVIKKWRATALFIYTFAKHDVSAYG